MEMDPIPKIYQLNRELADAEIAEIATARAGATWHERARARQEVQAIKAKLEAAYIEFRQGVRSQMP